MAAVVALEHISKVFEDNTQVVRDLSFEVGEGEIFCLLGPSGCGKTTTLRLVAGFERPDAGRILLQGREVAKNGYCLPPEKRGVGMVFQEYALFPHLTVAQNVAFGLKGFPKAQREAIVATMLNMVGMTELGQRYPHELSGGQQQRVALARALAPCPVVLLLDEPFSNLDADLRAQMRLEVRRILKEAKTTTIMVTHDQDEAFILGDRVAVLNAGHLEQVGTPEELYHQPASLFVADFVGHADLVPGVLRDGRIATEIGHFPTPWKERKAGAVKVLIRPDDITLFPHGEGEGVVLAREFLGSENIYTVRLASGLEVHSAQPSTVIYGVGQRMRVKADLDHVVAFPEEEG